MLKELERFHKKRSSLHKDASDNAICAALKQHTNDILAPKYGLDFIFWRFLYDPYSTNKAGYLPKYKELSINLAYDVEDNLEALRTLYKTAKATRGVTPDLLTQIEELAKGLKK